MFSYSITHIQPLTQHISQIFLQAEHGNGLSYAAGQYVEVVHHDQNVSPLSIACMPNDDAVLEFHLFHPVENERAQDLLRMAKQEKVWQLRGPFGICTAERIRTHMPILFLARDTGFAPIKAVIEALVKEQYYPPIHVYWSVKSRNDIYMTELLNEWRTHVHDFHFTPIFRNELPDNKEQATDLTLQHIISSQHMDLSSCQVYASASRPLVYAAFYAFQQHGLQQDFFYSDVFTQ